MFCQDLIDTASKTDCLASNEIFNGLTADQLALFETAIRNRTFSKGTTVFNENDHDDCFYIVKKGKVSLRFSLEVNTGTIRPIVQTVYENGILGELEFFDSRPRCTTAIIDEDTELLKIDREPFLNVIDNNPDISFIIAGNFNRILTSRIRRSDKQLKIALTMGWNAYKFDKY